jgi:tetratricopeptide (TPR) repeat protein
MELNSSENCLAVIASGARALRDRDFDAADKLLSAGLLMSQSAPGEHLHPLTALALYHISLLRLLESRPADSHRIREQASTVLERASEFMQSGLFHLLMSRVLVELGEFRRAIPFCEQTIELAREWESPAALAETLWRAGQCYARSGLKDHAVVPLRAAVKILQNQTGDPLLPAALLTLGNALRKSSPAEAESYYRQAAELHVARGQFQSATPTWVNLGVLCSEQGRHEEALEHYRRVLRFREQTPGTPSVRMGTLLNNIANCYRRMGKFADALASVDRAIKALEPLGGQELASAYGTRGLIFRDAQRDAEAVDWLRKAYDQQQKAPCANFDTLIEDLENEIAALRRLGRTEDLRIARQKLESVRAQVAAVPKTEHDLGSVDTSPRNAVIVELNFGSDGNSPYSPQASAKFGFRLSDLLTEQDGGSYSGRVVVPETTTLMFYGDDAEKVFQVLEPVLRSEEMCQGARVTIRNNGQFREFVLPSRVM